MSTSNTPRNTAYAEYVFTNLTSIVSSRVGLYSYSELAELVGLKPTHNFRKRVRQMTSEGTLQAVPTFTPRGGIELRFTAMPNEPIGAIPF